MPHTKRALRQVRPVLTRSRLLSAAEVERRKEHASPAVLAEAQGMVDSLAEAISAEKAGRAQAQARASKPPLKCFQALVSCLGARRVRLQAGQPEKNDQGR